MDERRKILLPIEAHLEKAKQLFDASLISDNAMVQLLLDHVKQQTGKMMRPILTLLTARLFGEPTEATYHAALALELLHTASLVHDDVVDESDKRRGQPALHVKFNNKYAVLTGDFLLGLSLQHAAMTQDVEIVSIVGELGKDLAAGEIIQLENTQKKTFTEDVYYDILKKKTAALFVVATHAGARSVRAAAEDITRVNRFSEMLGIAFQIRDDIFDYSDSEEIGKPTGNDMHEGKLTLPALYYINNSTDPSVKEMAYKIRSKVATTAEIADFVAQVKQAGGIAYAERTMQKFREEAIEALSPYTAHEVYPALIAYLDYTIGRTK